MTPQSAFFVLAPVRAHAEAELEALLESMNASPGHADPHNALIPFGDFAQLHFGRLCLVKDATYVDVAVYGIKPRPYPVHLVLAGEVDGSAADFITELAARAPDGLTKVFSFCKGFEPGTDVAGWMRAHSVEPAAFYVNWKGRTMLQVREESALRTAVRNYLDTNAKTVADTSPLDLHTQLRHFLSHEIASARLTMTPAAPTRFAWWMRDTLGLLGGALFLIVFSPILLLLGALFLVLVRIQESSDPEICPKADQAHVDALATADDRDVTNGFSAVGSIKPGPVRSIVSRFGLWLLNYALAHIYTTGRLARIRTIHFARWVWLGPTRLTFMSNYDGSLESYMDDFINKSGFGLNFVFSNGIGYPATRWLFAGGAKYEQKFKNYERRHIFYNNVWYNALPGLTAVDLERNARIRDGLEARFLTARQAQEWAALL